jgi:hypothetical protein
MIEQKQFNGVLNTDDSNDILPAHHHKDAQNIVFRGNGVNMKAENIPGTRLVSNTLPSGTNQTIGTHYDSLNNRIFYFNYNSNSTHGIYIYNTQAGTFQTLIQNGTNTVGDVLGFTANPITSINIIYGDPTDGDILYFVDTLGRPTKLNVQRYLAGIYTSIQRSYLDVAKMPPSSPIKAAYGADTTTNTNNLNNGLFQFIYRFVYDDNEKSVWSTGSEVPLPFMPNNDGSIFNAKYLNNYIALYFPTGDVNVKKIEIAFRETRDGATSDYSLITSLVKADLSINNNDVYNYNFYKNGIYTFIDKVEQLLLFDYVPQKANAQELLNGATLIYGGITEGYANVPLSASITQQQSASSIKYTCRNGLLFGAEQISANSIKIFVDGTVGTTAGTLASIYDSSGGGVVFNVNITDSSNTNLSFTYTATNNNTSTLLTGLASAASAKGFTTSVNTNSITITKTGVLLGSTLCQYNFNNLLNNSWEVIYSLYANAAYQYGVVYYDANGKTNGVNTIQALKLNTNTSNAYPDPEKEALYTYRQLTINNTPPSWAAYYQIVRTNNLTYGDKALYWVSSGAFSDKDVSVNQKYAYIRIDNIYDYNLSIKATEGVVGYTFSTGDRVKFIKLFNSTGSSYTDLASNNFDYPIISLESNPVMNGVTKEGSYLKIAYPASDISTSFDFTSSPEYQNYEIFIYNPAATASASEQTYFEFGQKYNIINGYHGGNYQNQTSGQSAIINFYDGDVFFRNRNVIVSPSKTITGQGIAAWATPSTYNYYTPKIGDSSQDVITSNYTIGHSVEQSVTAANIVYSQYPSWIDSTFNYQNTSSIDYNVRFKFSFSTYNTDVNMGTLLYAYIKVYNASTGFPTAQYPLTQIMDAVKLPQATNNTTYQIIDVNVDAIVKIKAGYKASILFYDKSGANRVVINPFTIDITPLRTINILVDDPSFSDVFNLQTNSSSRPLVVDINAKQAYYSTLVRYSQAYQQGTSINGTNRFYYLDFDTYDKKFGDIIRMKLHNRDLRIFQYKKCGAVPVYSVETLNQDGTNNLVASSKIINQIRYYEGDFGIGNQPASLATSGYADYFADPVKGYFVRLSQDGITPISELYKMQTFAGNNLTNYLSSHSYATGGTAKILGVFHFSKDRDGEFISVLQPGTGLTGYTLAFNEVKNAYTSFYSFNPESIVNFENKLASFKNGQLYIHDSSTQNNFYGTQYSSSITLVFNKDNIIKKTFDYLTLDATDYWTSATMNDVNTSLGQSSNLVQSDYEIHEGLYHGALLRDNNSLGGIINGDYLKGTWLETKFSNSATNLVYLSGLYLGYQLSNRNL